MLLRKIFATLLAVLLAFSVSAFAYAESAEGEDTTEKITTITEYEQVKEKQKEFLRSEAKGEGSKSPLEEYEEGFKTRASLSVEELTGMGYSNEDIIALKSYLNGDITFDMAATKASAKLTSKMTCPVHGKRKYSCKYSWEWNKTPIGLGKDNFGLVVSGLTKDSEALETKVQNRTGTVTYYYTDGTLYKGESMTGTISGKLVKFPFTTYKQNSTNSRWVWAKKGSCTLTVTQAVSTGKDFAAVRTRGEYGHSTTKKGSIDVSVSISGNSITFSFTHTKGAEYLTIHGKKQVLFYNDGTSFEE